MSPSFDRRRFLQSSAAATAAGFVAASATRAKETPSAQETFTVGIMGVRSRGKDLAGHFCKLPDAEVAYVCDVDESMLGPCADVVESAKGRRPKMVSDFRRILDDPAVDGLVIAAPDHWHAIAMIMGCQAGKHVFVEKPLSHNLAEGRRMVEAAKKYDRVVQVGVTRRSSESLQAMTQFLHGGGIGPMHFARCWIVSRREDIGHAQDGPTPAGIDYDMWLGAAPSRPFNPNHFHYRWHWQWQYGTGELGNNGIHGIDLARWGLGVEAPLSVVSSGGKHFFQDDQITPDTQVVCYEYPGLTLVWEHRTWSPHKIEGASFGAEFHGADGVVTTDGRGWWIERAGGPREPGSVPATPFEPAHERNWIDCVKSGEKPNADIEFGHTSTSMCHIGNISQKLGRKLSWDAERQEFPAADADADADANALLAREYRAPWTLPTV